MHGILPACMRAYDIQLCTIQSFAKLQMMIPLKHINNFVVVPTLLLIGEYFSQLWRPQVIWKNKQTAPWHSVIHRCSKDFFRLSFQLLTTTGLQDCGCSITTRYPVPHISALVASLHRGERAACSLPSGEYGIWNIYSYLWWLNLITKPAKRELVKDKGCNFLKQRPENSLWHTSRKEEKRRRSQENQE